MRYARDVRFVALASFGLLGCSQLLAIEEFPLVDAAADAPPDAPVDAMLDAPPDAPPDTAPLPACATTYANEFGGHRYARTPGGSQRKFDESEVRCAQDGGHLVKIETAAENAFVNSLRAGSRAWIGLDDRANEGTFVWHDGDVLQGSDYTDWSPGEPNNQNGMGIGGDCGELADNQWYDNRCDANQQFICECDVP